MKKDTHTQPKLARTTEEVKTTVGQGGFQYEVTVPSGTLCSDLGTHWVVQDLRWLDKSSGAYHDAHYRGIKMDPKHLDLGQQNAATAAAEPKPAPARRMRP